MGCDNLLSCNSTGYNWSIYQLEPETATLDEAEPNWKKSMTDYNVMIVTLARAAGENANYTPGEDG